jgi:single-strand DNA-binding protein
MPNYNKVLLMGNLTKDPELRFTTSGAPVTNLRIAVNRVFTNGTGEKKEETCFLTVVVWGKQAESCAEYLTKGRPVFIEGRLRTRIIQSQNAEEKNRTILEVIADRVQFLGGRRTEPSVTGAGVTSAEEKHKGEESKEEEKLTKDEKNISAEEDTPKT